MTLLPPPTFDVGRYRLRPLRVVDAEAWLAILDDPALRRLTSWNVDRVEELAASIVAITTGARAASTRRWAIDDDDGQLCGTCGFKDWDRSAGSAELMYELAASHRGRGAMSAIGAAVVEHGFADMRLNVISALVMVDNAASIRLLEKLGFERSAVLPQYRPCGGVVCDFARYERRRATPD